MSDIRGPNAKYGSDAWGVATRFTRSKLSPAASRVVDVAAGKNVVGDPVSPGQMAVDSVTPLSFKDIGEAIAEHGIQKGGAMALASLLGVGLQTYDSH